jgi:hypothetical protein
MFISMCLGRTMQSMKRVRPERLSTLGFELLRMWCVLRRCSSARTFTRVCIVLIDLLLSRTNDLFPWRSQTSKGTLLIRKAIKNIGPATQWSLRGTGYRLRRGSRLSIWIVSRSRSRVPTLLLLWRWAAGSCHRRCRHS